MCRWRHAALLLLIPLLVAVVASPVVAAPGKGVPKTNEDHSSWLVMDPVPESTEAESVVLSGKVAGNFDMMVANGSFIKEFEAKGHFSVEVPLFPGENRIQITGSNPAKRLLNYECLITTPMSEAQQPTELLVEVGQNTLVANGLSTMVIRALVLDANGDTVPGYNLPITMESDNLAAVTVLHDAVVPQGGIAVFTLEAGFVPEPSTITVTAPGVGDFAFTVAPAPQVAGSLTMETSSATLPVGDPSPAELSLHLRDAAGQYIVVLTSPLRVQLTVSNPEVASFESGAMIEFTMTTPTLTIPVYSGEVPGTARVSGAAVRNDGASVPVEPITFMTIATP